MFEPNSAAEIAAAGIEKYIRDNNLREGDLLPSEIELCTIMGFSRSSVREAMRILSVLDIIKVRRGFGTVVSSMSLKPLVAGLTLRASVNPDNCAQHLLQVIATREALECSVAQDLISFHTEQSLENMRTIVSQMLDSYMTTGQFAHYDRLFHSAMLDPISNDLIRELSDALWQVHGSILPMLRLPVSEELETTVRSHYDIVNAIENKDPDEVRVRIKQHYRPLRAVVSALVD